jgi:hypothetical protein
MANQPTPRTLQPPPDVPSLDGSDKLSVDKLSGYLRNFALWCRHGFADKLSGSVAQPGLMLSGYDAPAGAAPAIYMLEVSQAGRLMLAPMALGGGALGTPVPVASRTGVTDGSNAAAGEIGEYLAAASGSVALTTGVQTNIISLVLTPGDWDLWGELRMAATAGSLNLQGGITATSGGVAQDIALVGPTASSFYGALYPRRVSLTTTTTYYVTALIIFSSGTASATAVLAARRRR